MRSKIVLSVAFFGLSLSISSLQGMEYGDKPESISNALTEWVCKKIIPSRLTAQLAAVVVPAAIAIPTSINSQNAGLVVAGSMLMVWMAKKVYGTYQKPKNGESQ